MNHWTYRENTSPGQAMRSDVAHLGIGRTRQQPWQRREFFETNEDLAMVSSWKIGIWRVTIARRAGSEKPSGDRGGGADHARTVPVTKGDLDDETGGFYPKFAEAPAGEALAERQVIEFNHRLANVLQTVVALIERQRRRMEDNLLAQNELDSLAAHVQAVAALHRLLLPPRTPGHVDFGALIENVAVAIEGITGMICVVDAEPIHLPGHVAMHLAEVINELAWNAYKHAYGSSRGGVVRIACQMGADARLSLSVADRGCGLPANFDPHASEGFGLMIVCATARRFGGEIQVDSEQGTRFTLLLSIPLYDGGAA